MKDIVGLNSHLLGACVRTNEVNLPFGNDQLIVRWRLMVKEREETSAR